MEALRKRARILMWLVTVPFVLLALIGVTQIAFVFRKPDIGMPLLLAFAPMYIYIWAIWMVRQALSSIARGAMFDQVVTRLLFRVGLALFVGALCNVFGAPLVNVVFRFRLPMGVFDGAAITLGVVGATLVLLSQLLKQASAMRDELDSFF